MNKCLSVVAWGVVSVLGVNGVWASDAYYWGVRAELRLPAYQDNPSMFNPLGLGVEVDEVLGIVNDEEGLFAPVMLQDEGLWGARVHAFWRYAWELRHFPGWPSLGYLQRGRAGELYSMQLLLETIERQYPHLDGLTERQQVVLASMYLELAEMMLLLSFDESLLDDEERCHLVDLLGLLLRAPGASFKARSVAYHLIFQYYLDERLDYRVESYIDMWARALESGRLQGRYIRNIGEALRDCMRAGVATRIQQAAARAVGRLLRCSNEAASSQAEFVQCWLDLVFKHRCEPRVIQAIIQGMQCALGGATLDPEVRSLVFDALLLMHDSNDNSLGYRLESQRHWVTQALLKLWAEGLRLGWFDADQVRQLVPVIMEYREVTRCPLRTQVVVEGLIGLLHARAEDSAFRQFVYQCLERIFFAEGQREVVVGTGIEQLAELFVFEELPAWERIKIIAYLEVLVPQSQGYYLSTRFLGALQNMIHHPYLSAWEREAMLAMIQHLCAHQGDAIDVQVEALRAALDSLKKVGLREAERVAVDRIIESLPEEDDDLDFDEDDVD